MGGVCPRRVPVFGTMLGMLEVSYSEARAHLAELLDRVSDDREVVRIRRQGAKAGAVLLDADEYASLLETAHLFSSRLSAFASC